jgi:hypothetical protein
MTTEDRQSAGRAPRPRPSSARAEGPRSQQAAARVAPATPRNGAPVGSPATKPSRRKSSTRRKRSPVLTALGAISLALGVISLSIGWITHSELARAKATESAAAASRANSGGLSLGQQMAHVNLKLVDRTAASINSAFQEVPTALIHAIREGAPNKPVPTRAQILHDLATGQLTQQLYHMVNGQSAKAQDAMQATLAAANEAIHPAAVPSASLALFGLGLPGLILIAVGLGLLLWPRKVARSGITGLALGAAGLILIVTPIVPSGTSAWAAGLTPSQASRVVYPGGPPLFAPAGQETVSQNLDDLQVAYSQMAGAVVSILQSEGVQVGSQLRATELFESDPTLTALATFRTNLEPLYGAISIAEGAVSAQAAGSTGRSPALIEALTATLLGLIAWALATLIARLRARSRARAQRSGPEGAVAGA